MDRVKKFNYILLSAGILMIITSILNYQLNQDEVSMGIFVFAGIGFIFGGIKDIFEDARRKRMQRFSMMFYFIAVVIFVYWLIIAKLNVF
jgi:predicted nucleic acid-binding Zn ribbon protein